MRLPESFLFHVFPGLIILFSLAHYRGSSREGKRPLSTQQLQQQQQQQQRQQQRTQQQFEHPAPIPTRRQQTVHASTSAASPYQERVSTPAIYEEVQPYLPPITSLLGNVQQGVAQQPPSPHHPTLTRAQTSPTLQAQARPSRSPFGGSTSRPHSQAFTPVAIPPRRESTAFTPSQGWRDDLPPQDPYMQQPPLPMEVSGQPRPAPPQISPIRTTMPQQPTHISPQETPSQGFDFPYYAEPPPAPILPSHTQPTFYQQPPNPYIAAGTDILQPQYPFTPLTTQMQPPSVTYVGDNRAMLQGRAASMGVLRGSRLITSPQEEDKRRRAASASARFRRRKKEQEEENLREISRLEKRIEELRKEYFP